MDKYCILNWESGERRYFATEKIAVEIFDKEKKEHIDTEFRGGAIFDKMVFKLIDEYNDCD